MPTPVIANSVEERRLLQTQRSYTTIRELAEQNTREGAQIVEIGTTALPESDWIYDFSFPKEEGKPNPHLWTDPMYAIKYAAVIRDSLVQADAANADSYRAN